MDEKVKAAKNTADGAPDSTEIIETHSRQFGNPRFPDCLARSDTDDFKRFVLRSVQVAVFFKADESFLRFCEANRVDDRLGTDYSPSSC